jgi:outer membrane protein TolC
MLRTFAAVVALGVALLPARAEAEQVPHVLTFAQALAFAQAHKPELAAARSSLAASHDLVGETRARWLPTLTGTAQILGGTANNSTGSYVGVAGFDNPRVSATLARTPDDAILSPRATTLIGLGIRQELFDFGRISAQVAADDLRREAEESAVRGVDLAIGYDVEETYFAVHSARAVVTAAEQAFERAVVHRDQAKAGLAAGMRRPIELTRAEATVTRYDLERIHARQGLAVAQTVFAAALGAPDANLDAADTPPDTRDLPPLDRELAAAAQRNPAILEATATARAQEKQTRAIAAETRPNLLLTGAVSLNAGGSDPTSGAVPAGGGFLPGVPNWDVGLVLAWPLFDATMDRRVDRSRDLETKARSDRDVVGQRVVTAVRRAYVDVQAARDALGGLHRALEAALANDAQASARFAEGMSNAVELADAEELRTEAEIQLAQGDFELSRARAALGRAVAEDLHHVE